MHIVRLILWIALFIPFCIWGQPGNNTGIASASGQLFPIKQNYQWGFMNVSGNVVIPPQFDGVGNFGLNNHAPIFKGDKAGLIHVDGKLTVPPVYDDVFFLNPELIAVKEAGFYGVIDTMGNTVLKSAYTRIQLLNPKILLLYTNERVGLINLLTRQLIQPQFDAIECMNDRYFKPRVGKDYGYINEEGVIVIPPAHRDLIIAGGNAILFKDSTGKWGCFNGKSEVVLDPVFQKVWVIGHDLVKFRLDREFYLYSAILERTIARENVKEGNFYEMNAQDIAYYSKDGMMGLIHADGSQLLPCKYDSIQYIDDAVSFTFLNNQRGIFSMTTRTEINPRFQEIRTFDNVFKVRDSNLWGLANNSGELILEPEFTKIEILDNSGKAYKGKQLTTINFDENGRIVTENEYNNFRTLKVGGYYFNPGSRRVNPINTQRADNNQRTDGWFYDNKSRRWGMMNVRGDTLIKPSYDNIEVNSRLGLTMVSNRISPPVEFKLDGYIININKLYGIVKHDRGKQIGYVSYWKIYFDDFDSSNVARVIKPGGKFTLLYHTGAVSPSSSLFIGDYQQGRARYCEKGSIVVSEDTTDDQLGNVFEYLKGASVSSVLSNSWRPANGYRLYVRIENGKWGYLNEKGKVAIKPVLNYAEDYLKGQAIVKYNKRYGTIDRSGAYLLQPRFSRIDLLPNSNDSLYKVDQNKYLYGFIDEKGRVTVETQFSNAGKFSDGMAAVKRDNRWGYVDENGYLSIEPTYKKVYSFSDGLAAVKDRKYGYIDKSGKWATFSEYTKAGKFNEGHAAVVYKGKYGLINERGEFVLKPKYYKCSDVKDGLVMVKQKRYYGLKDLNDKWVLPPKYSKIGPFDENGLAIAKRRDHYGVIDREGKTVVKFAYKKILPYSEGLAVVRKKSSYGYINLDGEEVIKPQYNGAKDFKDGLAPVRQHKQWGYINDEGEMILESKFKQASSFSEKKAYVRIGRQQGFINTTGEFVFKSNMTILSDFKENRIVARENGKYLFLNEYGRQVPDEYYDVISEFNNGRAMVKKDGKWGVINPHGIYVFQPKYDGMEPYSEGKSRVRMNAFTGLADLDGNMVINCEYEVIRYVGSNLYRIERSDDLGYMDAEGNWVWPMQN